MNFAAEQISIASLISKRLEELTAAGLDDVTLFGEMAEYMPGFQRLMETQHTRRNGQSLRFVSWLSPVCQDP